MNHNFKPGDLAMIVGAFSVTQNIGMACELVEHLEPEQVSQWRDQDGYRQQNGDTGPAWIVIGEGLASWCGGDGWCLVDSKHLMPLRGDFAPERQKSQEVPA
ncbi:hypothetical protein NS337_03550 [Pseudomonas oryzihabitans]|uniref:hypothetical protein n=1 Tax=Pseudomonas oryzihabitans TaxID=47885 RepID=UPI0007372C7E|nr:hypothetical protein [Pseudomonas psychrotolerans]KTT56420.1 hypothetical protein NS337_03550 [Pseudomonas psychrotolerans]